MVFKLYHGTYKSKSTSFQAKLQLYYAVVGLACLYAVDELAKIEDPSFEKKERKFQRRIVGPRKVIKKIYLSTKGPTRNYMRR